VIVLVSAVAGLATVAGFALGHSRHLDAGPDLA
jgi:hypothetical protein